MPSQTTRIHAVFLSSGRPVGFDAYRQHHPDVNVPENQDIWELIDNELEDIELVGTPQAVKPDDVIPAIRDQGESLDGLLVFGPDPEKLLALGLPTVAVERPLEGCTTVPFRAYKDAKAVTAFLPAHRDKDPQTYSLRIEDIAGKLNLIAALHKMKGLRILVITDRPPLGYFEPMDVQIETNREEYEQVYVENLEQLFGAELVPIPQDDLFGRIREVDGDAAKQIADRWIGEALALRGTNETQVLESAKLYVAMKELMEQHDCGAITTEGFGWPPHGYDKGIPSQGLPTSQFCTDGIAAASETLMDCLLTQQLALYITGSAGLLGDYTIDPFNGTAIIAHCEGTFKPYADQANSPYLIRNLPFVPENESGACAQINYPVGDAVTVAKIGTNKRKLSLFTGQTVSGEELFPYWEDILGRNKVAIKTDAKALLENVDWIAFGNHRTVLFGDHRQQFRELASLLGLEVVEKDR